MDITYVLTKNSMPDNSWRFGIYRAPSIFANANSVIFYTLLILSIYLSTSKKINYSILFIILSGILFSGSRSGYVALSIVLVLLIIKNMRMRLFIVISVIILTLSSTFWDLNIMKINSLSQRKEVNTYALSDEDAHDIEVTQGFFRAYTKKKSIEIWKDHPMIGVGPGMYGGVVSKKTHTNIYNEYNFLPNAINYIEKWSGIDQYWPQIIVEIGIIGFLNFAVFFFILEIGRAHV